MAEITLHSLSEGKAWPGTLRANYERHKWPGKVTPGAAISELKKELERIAVHHGRVELEIQPSKIRLDGTLRAEASPTGPQVRLTFDHQMHGPVAFCCDKYLNWYENLRAISLTLHDLRVVEGRGAIRGAQHYAGFKQLPGAIELAPTMNVEQAREALGLSRDDVDNAERVREAYRKAARTAHPDHPEGSDRAFRRVTLARDTLVRSYGLKL